jgi:hypothetical protein
LLCQVYNCRIVTQPLTSDLKACPFCGDPMRPYDVGPDKPHVWMHAKVSHCIIGAIRVGQDAIAAWNTRSLPIDRSGQEIQDRGASVPDQALVASDQAAARLAPSGFDPSRGETVFVELRNIDLKRPSSMFSADGWYIVEVPRSAVFVLAAPDEDEGRSSETPNTGEGE